jgi:small subunit ribosomal protein S3
VGQKVHPNAFRLGINRKHKATWFAPSRKYKKVLQEDSLIRQFLETEFESVYTSAGISTLEILRKINQVDLLFHAVDTDEIQRTFGKTDSPSFILLQRKIHKIFDTPKQLRIKVLKIRVPSSESKIVARSIGDSLEKRVKVAKALRDAVVELEQSSVTNFKIQISGRLNGVEMARSEWQRKGRIPLQTLRVPINYSTHRAYTKYGVVGIKVWISRS